MKTFKIYTLGCKVNQYDTQVIREGYQRRGFREITGPDSADIYIINTCTVTAAADKKSRHYIHRARRENPVAKIIVSGCYAQLDGKLLKKMPGVSAVKKTPTSMKSVSGFAGHTRAFLKIQDGCDNSCSYCKVHIVRGRSRSKPLNEVMAEAKELSGKGFKEIVLCGVCLGLYGRDLPHRPGLVDVIIGMEKIAGLERIRLSSLEAWDIGDDLITHLAASPKLCRHLHIPIQSGSDTVLKQMNRRASFFPYATLFRRLKKRLPDLAISTDIMIGFPGETEKDFRETIKLLRIAKPLKVHIFPYSPRQGTTAANLTPLVSPEVVAARIAQLKKISAKFAADYQNRFLGKTVTVLIECRAKQDPKYWEGHTGNYLKVWVKSNAALINHTLRVKLKCLSKDYFLAEIY